MGFWKKALNFGKDVSGVSFAEKVGESLGILKDDATREAQRAEQQFAGIEPPTIKNLDLNTNERKYVDTPLGSRLEGIKEDSQLRDAQLGALQGLQEVATTGFTEADRAAQQEIQRNEAIREQGQREALQRNAQARGAGGSGFELAGQLANQQGAADRAAQQGVALAGMGADRRLQGIQAAGQLGGQIRGQEFGQKAQVAAAQDAIRVFNAQSRNEALTRDVANQNTEKTANTFQVPQQNFNNSLAIAQARADAINQVGQQRAASADRLVDTVGNISKGAGAAFGGG